MALLMQSKAAENAVEHNLHATDNKGPRWDMPASTTPCSTFAKTCERHSNFLYFSTLIHSGRILWFVISIMRLMKDMLLPADSDAIVLVKLPYSTVDG